MKKFTRPLLICLCFIALHVQAQMQETWIDYANNNQLILYANGTFQFSNSATTTQGSYAVANNVLMLQDANGNNYQYAVQAFNNDSMVLVDNLGIRYNYVKSQTNANNVNNSNNNFSANNTANMNFPWDKAQYMTVLAEKDGYQWRERENQLYVELLELLIGQKATTAEVNRMREDFKQEFLSNPQKALNDIKSLETPMQQIYTIHDMEKIAMLREVVAATFYETIQQQPEMNNYAFVQILHNHVKVLSLDSATKLNLSNQDAQAYINYLQFQMMLAGQNYQLSQQQRLAMQMYLANQFPQLPLQQKQALAFASFIWDNVQRQWSSMSVAQQQQYIAQVQNQLNIQNQQVNMQNVNSFWNSANTQNYDSYSNYNNTNSTALSASAFEAQMQANQNIFQMMENSMTEQHVTMMNIINSDSDYEYVVKYNDDY